MIRRVLTIIIGALAVGAVPAEATTLVNPAGQPLTGNVATWAAHMHVASIRGHVKLGPTVRRRQDLYYALGAAFDNAYLSDRNRARLGRWVNQDIGEHLTSWIAWTVNFTYHDDGTITAEVDPKSYDQSLGVYFYEQYANCAERDTVNEDRRICAYVNQVGRAHHAARPFRCPRGQFRWLDPACYPSSRERVGEAVKWR